MHNKPKLPGVKNPLKDRTAIQHRYASDYLLITLISFAISVGGTRLFLEITGFPQLGGGELHIAHVLWGGIFLFVASIIPLIFANTWALPLSAAIAGFGIGLFIDEVGKFITQSNDYFHPSAAPIIYVLFLLTALLFSQVRRRQPQSPRSKMYTILEQFQEVLDHDLSSDEYVELIVELDEVISINKEPPLVHLAQDLKSFLVENQANIVPKDSTFFDKLRIWFLEFEKKWLSRQQLKRIIILGLLIWAAWAMISPIGYLLISRDTQQLKLFADQLISNRLVRNISGLNWFEARVLVEGGMGVFSLVAAAFFMVKKEKIGVWIGIVDLLVTLTVVNLLIFYFDQFSTILLAAFHFILFVLLLRYQRRFFPANKKLKERH